MKALVCLITALIAGCGHIADFYDRQDPCQIRSELGRPKDYSRPTWCGTSSGRVVIYNTQGQPIGYIRP